MTVWWYGMRSGRSLPQSKNGLITTERCVYGAESRSLNASGSAEPVGVERLVPGDPAVDRLRVRVEQQLARVAPVAAGRVVGPVHAVAVALARHDPRQVAVPDQRLALGEVVAGLDAVVVEQAQLHPLRDLGEDREVGAATVVGRAEGVRRSGPHVHGDAPAAQGPRSRAVPI